MQPKRNIFKESREQRGLSTIQVGKLLGMDSSLVSRIENGKRRPTREQLLKLADLYKLDQEKLLIDWLSDKVVRELEGEKLAKEVIEAVELKIFKGD